MADKVELTPFFHAVAGGVGGVLALTCTYPLDIVKTRIQVQNRELKNGFNYNGTFDALFRIAKEEGILGLYTGLQSGLIATLINQFSYYYFYEFLKPYYQQRSQTELGTAAQLILGMHAAAMNVFTSLPINVINTRIQTHKGKPKGIFGTLQDIVSSEGLQGLWSGLGPSLILCINPSITFFVFEKLKALMEHSIRKSNPSAKLSAFQVFYIGAIAKTVATVVTYPYIVAKVRLQWKSVEVAGKYKNVRDVASQIIRTEGVRGLYKGMQPQIVKAVLTQAILFAMKEEIMAFTVKLILLYYGVRRGKVAKRS